MSFQEAQAAAVEDILAELGQDVVYKAGGSGEGVTVRAMFYNGYEDVEVGDATVAASSPTLVAAASAIADAQPGDTFTVEGVVWTGINPEPDGQGLIVYRLEAPGA